MKIFEIEHAKKGRGLGTFIILVNYHGQELKNLETDKKDLEMALEEVRKELLEIQSDASKNKQILSLTEDDKLNLEEQVSELDAQNRKMRRQFQEMTEDLKDREVEVEGIAVFIRF